MKQKIAVQIVIGFFIGIFANLAGSYLYIYFFSEFSIEETIRLALQEDVFGNIVAIGALFNLAAFFILLKKKRHYRARGVILATIVGTIFIVISKFM